MKMCNSLSEEEPHPKKQKLLSLPQSSSPITSLPDDAILNCLARVSRSDLAALYLVSKRLRSLVVSSELYMTRSLMDHKEECLYVCLATGYNLTPRWLIIARGKPENRLVRSYIPLLPSQPTEGSSIVTLDTGIYVIGGYLKGKRTSDVFFLDCMTHKWKKVPSMRVARVSAAAGVVDGKIYVFGGCERSKDGYLSYGEVFDPKTQTWETLVSLPDWTKGDGFIQESLVVDDKVYAVCKSQARLYYSPNECKWGKRERDFNVLELGIYSYCCVVENLLYSCDRYGNVYWSESKELDWKEVKGLDKLDSIFFKREMSPCDQLLRCESKLRQFGRNVLLIWFKYKGDKVDICCAEISFERHRYRYQDEDDEICDKDEIWGTIEWLETVATADRDPSSHLEVLGTTTVDI